MDLKDFSSCALWGPGLGRLLWGSNFGWQPRILATALALASVAVNGLPIVWGGGSGPFRETA